MTVTTDADAEATLAQLYDFAATAFADPPTEAWIRTLCDGALPDPAVAPNDRLAAGLEALRTWADGVDDPAAEADRLASEYTRLFVGPRPQLQIHESWYADDFLGEPLAAVSKDYDTLGIEPAADLKEEADHAAVELAALRELSRRAASDPDAKARFLAAHGDWFDALAADVRETADDPFYPAVADVAAGLVAVDADGLEVDR
ncbi:MAG: TorD/DmsD family molecular chaperone [Halobacteriota archaeon]